MAQPEPHRQRNKYGAAYPPSTGCAPIIPKRGPLLVSSLRLICYSIDYKGFQAGEQRAIASLFWFNY